MSESLVVALDSGTQSSRAIAFDRTGATVATGSAPHPPLTVGGGGAVTQRPQDVWEAVQAAARACTEALGPRAGDVERIGLTTQRYTMIPCTGDGTPLMDAIHWLDRRSAELDGSALLRVIGWIPTLRTVFANSRGQVLRTVAPEIHARTERFLPLSAWLTLRLTGEAVDTPGSFPGLWPMDGPSGTWHDHDRVARLVAVDRGWLPPLVAAGETLGTLSAAAAEATGLPVGTPLVAVGGDKQAEILGSGTVAGNTTTAAISLGTAATVTTLVQRFQQDLRARIFTIAAAEPDAWCLEYMVSRGMWMVTWVCRDLLGVSSPESLEAEAKLVAPGAEGLTCLPRWSAPVSGSHERGGLLGFTEVHGRGHVYRAIIEGICMDLRRGLEMLERQASRQFGDLRVGGGGCRSAWVVQTLADVIGRPIRTGRTLELSALGAAVGAAVSAGWYPDHASAAAAMSGEGESISPRPDAVSAHDAIYQQVYLRRLKGHATLMGS